MRYLLLLTSFLFADIAIEPYATSYHFDRDKGYNENHKYLGLVYRYQKYEVGVATMENSHNRRSNSVYVGYRQDLYKTDIMELGGNNDVGYRTGYNRKLLLFGGLYVEHENMYVKIAVGTKLVAGTVGYIFRFEGL